MKGHRLNEDIRLLFGDKNSIVCNPEVKEWALLKILLLGELNFSKGCGINEV